jgi:hypothetical protein
MFRMSGTSRFSALFLSFIVLTAAIPGQSSAPANNSGQPNGQLPPKLVEMLKTQMAWDVGFSDPSGPRLRFAKFGEFTQRDGHFTRYRVFAERVEGGPYILAVLNIGVAPQDVRILTSAAYANRRGLLLTRKPKPYEEDSEAATEGVEYDLGIRAANGEPIRFLLRSKDNKVFVPGTLVPFPIESTDKGCRLEARLAVPEGQAILMYGDGFPPNSEVLVQGDSAGELKEGKHPVDAGGHFQFVELPSVLGKDTGILKETITTKDCSVTASIAWGKSSYQKH